MFMHRKPTYTISIYPNRIKSMQHAKQYAPKVLEMTNKIANLPEGCKVRFKLEFDEYGDVMENYGEFTDRPACGKFAVKQEVKSRNSHRYYVPEFQPSEQIETLQHYGMSKQMAYEFAMERVHRDDYRLRRGDIQPYFVTAELLIDGRKIAQSSIGGIEIDDNYSYVHTGSNGYFRLEDVCDNEHGAYIRETCIELLDDLFDQAKAEIEELRDMVDRLESVHLW